MKLQSKTFQKFKSWLKLLENQLDKKLNTLRTNNGWNSAMLSLITSVNRREL